MLAEEETLIEENTYVFSDKNTDIYEDLKAENNPYTKQKTPKFSE